MSAPISSRYLIVSDLHIADIEEHADGWKAFKRAQYSIDRGFDVLVRHFVAEGEAARDGALTPLTLILNGDIIDFDVVIATPGAPLWPVSRAEKRHGLEPTENKAVWKLNYVLSQHPQFVETLARFVERGHRIVYLMGNHDREFHFDGVQRALVAAVEKSLGASAARAFQFEPWFYYVPGQLYVEHGQQYDLFASYRHVLFPVVATHGGPAIAIPMGNLSGRYLASKMGFFNPYTSEFILNLFSYLAHWLKHYAFTRRSLFFNWFWGSILVMVHLLKQKEQVHKRPPDYDARLDGLAVRTGLSRETIDALGRLQRQPMTARFFRVVREFWIDRVLIAVFMTCATIALALVPVPLWTKLIAPLACFPLVFFIYETLARGETVFTVEHEVPIYAQKVALLTDVKLVTFGHTHRPRLIPLAKDVAFVDTGTWAPMMSETDRSELAPGYRNYLIADFSGERGSFALRSWI